MNRLHNGLVLGIETGLGGGGVSIIKAGQPLDYLEGSEAVSKSEDVLLLIERILKKNNVLKKEIGRVVVSDGPGSFTGIRIGLATAKGLGDALSVEVVSVSVLRALISQEGIIGSVLGAVYSKKADTVYVQEFHKGKGKDVQELSPPKGYKIFEAIQNLNALENKDKTDFFVITNELDEKLKLSYEWEKILGSRQRIVVNQNPAVLLGLMGQMRLIM